MGDAKRRRRVVKDVNVIDTTNVGNLLNMVPQKSLSDYIKLSDGDTFLLRAAREHEGPNRSAEALYLLKRGFKDINALDKVKGFSAMHYACIHGDVKLVQILLKYGANVNIKTKFEEFTPLYLATLYQRENVVRILLKQKGIEVDAKTSRGRTALHEAAMYTSESQENILRLLLESRANRNISDKNGMTPMDLTDGIKFEILNSAPDFVNGVPFDPEVHSPTY